MSDEGQEFAIEPIHDCPKERTGEDIGKHSHDEHLPNPGHVAGDN
jgi:hypothetical protein